MSRRRRAGARSGPARRIGTLPGVLRRLLRRRGLARRAAVPGVAATTLLALLWHGSWREDRDPVVPRELPVVTTTTPAEPAATTAPEPRWEVDPPRPVRVNVPKVGIDAEVIDLWLNPDGTLQVPSDFAQTGWWAGGAGVGEAGPAVIVGHVDSWRGPAVFFRLGELEPGDEVHVLREDGSVRTFVAYAKERVPKDQFPTDRVYGPTEVPELRLVTCGGDFDRSRRSYEDNVIVYLRIAEASRS